MKLFYDLRLGYFVTAPGQESELIGLQAKAGDTEEVIVQFGRSSDPTIAALRLLLASWAADVWSDDPRIQLGLAKLVETDGRDELAGRGRDLASLRPRGAEHRRDFCAAARGLD